MKHIILTGFKHVGKTSIGQKLAKELDLPFVDLDVSIEQEHENSRRDPFGIKNQKLTVRQIVLQEGLDFFRNLEMNVLKKVLEKTEKSIISLGGGTPIHPENREAIIDHFVVNITADKSNIYERIMINGRPAFFPEDEDPYMAFKRVWGERTKIYDDIAQITVSNNEHIDKPVQELKRILV